MDVLVVFLVLTRKIPVTIPAISSVLMMIGVKRCSGTDHVKSTASTSSIKLAHCDQYLRTLLSAIPEVFFFSEIINYSQEPKT